MTRNIQKRKQNAIVNNSKQNVNSTKRYGASDDMHAKVVAIVTPDKTRAKPGEAVEYTIVVYSDTLVTGTLSFAMKGEATLTGFYAIDIGNSLDKALNNPKKLSLHATLRNYEQNTIKIRVKVDDDATLFSFINLDAGFVRDDGQPVDVEQDDSAVVIVYDTV